MSLRVLIAGGGIGGLCLAQGLRQAGIQVSVFEREASAESRGQGYRLRITPEGDAALRECLPAPLFDLYRATANRPSRPPIGAFDYQMNLIYRLDSSGASASMSPTADSHQAVNRRTLRQILLGGLEDTVHFGHTVADFEQDADGVRARLADGRMVAGDVLVAADGIGSAVRRGLLPDARIRETDMRCIYGITPLDADTLESVPEPLFNGFTPVLGRDRCTLALGMYRSCRPQEEAARELAPGVRLDPVPDYLMWMFVAPKAAYLPDDEGLWTCTDPDALHGFVMKRTADWHSDLRRLLDRADVGATFPVAIRSSLPVPPWPSGRVTLLGDAIHAMTPAGGIGANTALKDAALLTRHLTAADRGKTDLLTAIGEYEPAMRDYGFAAVERSLNAAVQLYRISLTATNEEAQP